jgi:hypothetical protein
MAIYIRLIVETFTIICISFMTEFKNFDTQTFKSILSLVMCFLLAFSMILFMFFNMYLIWKGHPNLNERLQLHFGEFFSGLKETTKSRLNSIIFFVSRFLFVVVVIALEDISVVLKVILFGLIQASCIFYIIIVRPYKEVRDNIIE